ncbi:hypothetical protein [Bosea sp. 117]|uniref:hypothetical protein n=1 Tax=Bosea sp. 117 TaxID=1125973 RepID=UPI000B29A5F2|nr:hypothetical protein [Bosea sp. 117]
MSLVAPAEAQWIGEGGGGAIMSPVPNGAPADMAPAGPDAGGFSPAPGMSQRPGPATNCQADVDVLRGDLDARGKKLEASIKKKAGPVELCPMFRNFVTAQEKFYNYLNKNQQNCGVPPDLLKKVKANTMQVADTRNKVCKAAAMAESGGGGGGGGGPPPQGQLSSGLGLPSGIPSVQHSQQKGGVFDTLGGSALR